MARSFSYGPISPIFVFKNDDSHEHLPNVKNPCRFLLLTFFVGAVYFLSLCCVFTRQEILRWFNDFRRGKRLRIMRMT